MKFKTAYEGHERTYSPTGKPVANTWQHVKNKHGVTELKRTGTKNVQEMIQEAYEETKIENILARVVNGDTSLLKANGQFIDCTQIPTNLNDAMHAIQTMENMWRSLPQEIKNEYNNNVEEFVAAAGTENWLKKLGYITEEKTEPVKETIIEKEKTNEGAKSE